MKMFAMVIDRYGPPEVLHGASIKVTSLGPFDVLIKNYATSVNPVDWKVRQGFLQARLSLKFPAILGWDAAGVIEQVGAGVSRFQVGDKVFTRPAIDRPGTYAEYVVVNENLVAEKPTSLNFLKAVCVPLAGLTAWEALVEHAHIRSGQRILIHGGAGGVGGFAIQLAKAMGLYVLTTTRKVNTEYVTALGADDVIDYESQAFERVVEDVDVVLDTIGGTVQEKSFGVLRPGGILVSIAQPPDQKQAEEHHVKAVWFFLEPDGKKLQALGQLFAEGKMKPTVGNVFALRDIQAAHVLSQSGHSVGKIGIVIDPEMAYQH
ncbi:NADP-dependent oxidoreductase [Sulfobacillus thermosulfidooxidans]|uniref:NADP-dependent oxidoreductase n=1 Tax=Sulfobacillus thermosulfidooxidans TaxID=28034 RepID=UPI0002FA9865|nr:NADP-dependent oxidoreductase [Sulfobacillus thermosulfidooxidans]